jgi:hypothetical protein
MSAVLGQLAIALGGVLFIVTLTITLLNGTPVMPAIFRAFIVMCIGSVCIAVFFRFLSSVLHNFVIDKIKQYNIAKAKGGPKKQRRMPSDGNENQENT